MDENINEGATAPLPEQGPGVPRAEVASAPGTPPGPPIAYGAAPQDAAAPGYATVPPARAPRVWHVQARWVAIAACVIAAIVLLGVAFGVGVGVGRHSARFEGRLSGPIIQTPYGQHGQNGRQNNSNGNQYNYDYRGYGGRGRIFPRGIPSPDTTTTP